MKRKSKNESVKALDIVAAIGSVTKEKSISMDLVIETLRDALCTAAKRYLGKPTNVEVKVEKERGLIEVYTRQTVVETITDPEKEISVEEAKGIDPELEVGDELMQDLDIDLFGRTAIATAKQVIIQRVREAEREKVFADYSERIGELVTGTVQQIDKGNILINLGRTEALLPYKEQIRKERYRQGDPIKGCIADVKNNPKGPQVIISRTAPQFLARLFELEVPEIFDKTVKIVKVVRDPGFRSKIAVTTSDDRVDPVGACVGMRGNRVQAIVRELSNERIDIINWTDELSLLVRRVFSPAEVKRVVPINDKKVVVIIREDDLAQAIGKEGQNIRLASKMLERDIDVYGDEEFVAFTEEERTAIQSGLPIKEPDEEAAEVPLEGGATAQDAAEDLGAAREDANEAAVAVDNEVPVETLVENAVENDSEAEIDIDPDKPVQNIGPAPESTGEGVDEEA
jgi:transcription termination/antitermination protein NusA